MAVPAWLTGGVIGKFLDLLKGLAVTLFIRRSTKLEVQNEITEDTNETLQKQRDIANRPDASASDVRRRMQDGKF